MLASVMVYAANGQGAATPFSIPDSLLQHASIIKLSEEVLFEVKDIDKASLSVSKTFTVLNERGKDALFFHEYTNRFIRLEEAEINVLDPSGKTVEKIRKRDMRTEAVGEGLVEDGMYTYYVVKPAKYPITVSFNYRLSFSGTLFYPEYEIQNSGEAVLASSFTAKVPASLGLRHKSQHIKIEPVVSSDNKYISYTWNTNLLKAPLYEEDAVHYRYSYPRINLAPNKFSIYDTEGDMTSWKSFGAWEYALTKELGTISEDRKLFFMNMVKDAKSEREKAAILYRFLQDNFRYVSIQLGIGSYKPFPAGFTDDKKYGDCKGLSFYMQQLLKAVGVRSYVALINAGHNLEPVDPAFPCNQFNHMILCIPGTSDSTWLECTSKLTAFGELGSFTENRYALLITENGGELVRTPPSKAETNRMSMNSVIAMEPDGSGRINATIRVNGAYQAMAMDGLIRENKDKQKKFLIESMGIRQPDNFELDVPGINRPDSIHLSLEYAKITDFTAGDKRFLPRAVFRFHNFSLPAGQNRKLDYFFTQPFIKSDTTIYVLPEGYRVETIPENFTRSCPHAEFNSKSWYDATQRKLYSTTTLSLYHHRIPAKDYEQVRIFFESLRKNNPTQIILVKEN